MGYQENTLLYTNTFILLLKKFEKSLQNVSEPYLQKLQT